MDSTQSKESNDSLAHVDRMALVSKILFDVRLLELRRENEALRLQLFWKDHGPSKLNFGMHLANTAEGGPGCRCLSCVVSGRWVGPDTSASDMETCAFKPWFEHVLECHGLVVGRGLPADAVWVDGKVIGDHNNVLDDGRHFSNLASCDWFCWTYGSLLWKAATVRDPELAKLKRLFTTLELSMSTVRAAAW